MKTEPITPDEIIILYYEAAPTVFWKIDSITICQVRVLKNPNGEYLWRPHVDKYSSCIGTSPGTLHGIPIVVVPKKDEVIFQMETHFPDGKVIISKLKGLK